VNGERRQTGSTHEMIFNVATILHYVSQFMVLEPGDLVNTGTPPGVAMGMAEPGYLHAGDVMTLGNHRTRRAASGVGLRVGVPIATGQDATLDHDGLTR
jgi:2-keto-4-pentenoate hydratase/2-oxohepta-3-ene-1,7-dioic acid hydratase in catechol pathway